MIIQFKKIKLRLGIAMMALRCPICNDPEIKNIVKRVINDIVIPRT